MDRRQSLKLASAVLAALLLVACGGGGGGSSSSAMQSVVPSGPGSPTATGSLAADGLNWINYRRGQAGIPLLSHNALIDKAAQSHSDYQRLNNVVDHNETAGKPGYTGSTLLARLNAAGYFFGSGGRAYGEVISAASSSSGAYMAEELITAIYHRFVIFEPKFKEIGTGAATNANGYAYFTTDFTSNNGYGAGIGHNAVVVWPYDSQADVPRNFLSDYEAPDPVAGVNEVGYPVSVHADIDAVLTTISFTLRARGAASNVEVKLLVHDSDSETPPSAAAIIPMQPLQPNTVYDAIYSGRVDGTNVSKTWSFTTRP